MKRAKNCGLMIGALCFAVFSFSGSHANAYRPKGVVAKVGSAGISVKPPRDWNRLDIKPGKFAETWTLDGEQLNEVTFYTGVESGQPIVRERNKKREPLPKFTSNTLLVEVPELLEGTYRSYRKIAAFTLTNSAPGQFLGREGVHFSYDYTDQDDLPRKGNARAVIIGKKLYMITFDAPRIYYFDRVLEDYRLLAESAKLTG